MTERKRLRRPVNGDHEVGYGKPPVNTRFKPGQSGNPKGRPKGTNNLRRDVQKLLKKGVPLNEHGRRRTVSTQEAALLRLREKALKGDARALDLLLELAGRFNNDDPPPAADNDMFPKGDREIINAYLARQAPPAAKQDERPSGDGSPRPTKRKVKRVRRRRRPA
jgi:hypothetical protein